MLPSSDGFLENFKNFINEHALFNNTHKILLAVSGGIDSIVLYHLFSQIDIRFGVAHCNFNLRADESEADELFVKNLAQKVYQVPFFTKKFDTLTYAQTYKLSIQMAARQLRYQWFEELAHSEGYDLVATGHHQNDVLETVLYNLTKGTGIAGLHGILPKTNFIIRPLLFATRQQIENYAVSQGLRWREDSSNFSSKYARNLIRNEVIPLLKQINPGLEQTFQHTLEKIKSTEKAFRQYIHILKEKYLHKKNDVWYLALVAELMDETLLLELIREFGFSFEQATQILQHPNRQAGKEFFSKTHSLVFDREQLVIAPLAKLTTSYSWNDDTTSLELPHFSLEFSLEENKGIPFENPASIGVFDYQKLPLPLIFRQWQAADRFQPLGMKGFKKVSDFLNDHKIPRNLKDRIWVMCSSDGEIAWVIGMRMDDRFKVTHKTTSQLKIVLNNSI